MKHVYTPQDVYETILSIPEEIRSWAGEMKANRFLAATFARTLPYLSVEESKVGLKIASAMPALEKWVELLHTPLSGKRDLADRINKYFAETYAEIYRTPDRTPLSRLPLAKYFFPQKQVPSPSTQYSFGIILKENIPLPQRGEPFEAYASQVYNTYNRISGE